MEEKLDLVRDLDVEYLYVLTTYLEANKVDPIELERILVGTSFDYGRLIGYDVEEIFVEALINENKIESIKNRVMEEIDKEDECKCENCNGSCGCKKDNK